ncbi:MAG: hypothetical protein KVP17_002911 [Porospora cf. gigantea B]|uniref:uncharacterized protein n=1 Tax=Porospora cf. gigantea B TaxID=2853592 RepID=UPI003571A054|nr:MAG: hypothetical protein KVP17_002911 [Porospora cf. gigantea B]
MIATGDFYVCLCGKFLLSDEMATHMPNCSVSYLRGDVLEPTFDGTRYIQNEIRCECCLLQGSKEELARHYQEGHYYCHHCQLSYWSRLDFILRHPPHFNSCLADFRRHSKKLGISSEYDEWLGDERKVAVAIADLRERLPIAKPAAEKKISIDDIFRSCKVSMNAHDCDSQVGEPAPKPPTSQPKFPSRKLRSGKMTVIDHRKIERELGVQADVAGDGSTHRIHDLLRWKSEPGKLPVVDSDTSAEPMLAVNNSSLSQGIKSLIGMDVGVDMTELRCLVCDVKFASFQEQKIHLQSHTHALMMRSGGPESSRRRRPRNSRFKPQETLN